MENLIIPINLPSSLLEEINSIVATNPNYFISVDKFVEKAIRQYISTIKYNIEGGVAGITNKDGTLRKSERVLTMCMSCWRPFLKMRNNQKESGKICPSCRINILFFFKLLEQEDSRFGELKEHVSFVDETNDKEDLSSEAQKMKTTKALGIHFDNTLKDNEKKLTNELKKILDELKLWVGEEGMKKIVKAELGIGINKEDEG